jgi:hypothetical protein
MKRSVLPSDQTQNKPGGESLEATSHPFVIRIWLEESAQEAQWATWRGHITHVPSGERCYIQDLDQIQNFIIPYLEDMGIKFGAHSRVRRRISHLKS